MSACEQAPGEQFGTVCAPHVETRNYKFVMEKEIGNF
jgi:hypothetical protein